MLLPATASAKDSILVCRGGKFRMIVHATDKGPVLAANFKRYSNKGIPFVKDKNGNYPYTKLSAGQCGLVDEALATTAEHHFVHKFKSPVDICAGILLPKFKTKDVHWHLGTTKKTSYVDKSFLLGLTNSNLLLKLKVFVANKGTKHAYFVVKQPLGVYKRTAPDKMLYGAAFAALLTKPKGNSLSCMQKAVQDQFKVK
ncbi:MAG: hypothetical protein DRI90_02825 [Deltaproteobacteria bacterium]|nr:MAG: hypothetical protein DRI90_02825 [Deltaproteobacteria bacterium]